VHQLEIKVLDYLTTNFRWLNFKQIFFQLWSCRLGATLCRGPHQVRWLR